MLEPEGCNECGLFPSTTVLYQINNNNFQGSCQLLMHSLSGITGHGYARSEDFVCVMGVGVALTNLNNLKFILFVIL